MKTIMTSLAEGHQLNKSNIYPIAMRTFRKWKYVLSISRLNFPIRSFTAMAISRIQYPMNKTKNFKQFSRTGRMVHKGR